MEGEEGIFAQAREFETNANFLLHLLMVFCRFSITLCGFFVAFCRFVFLTTFDA
jgi:hypothetical protein